jgi:hypothetical protein
VSVSLLLDENLSERRQRGLFKPSGSWLPAAQPRSEVLNRLRRQARIAGAALSAIHDEQL